MWICKTNSSKLFLMSTSSHIMTKKINFKNVNFWKKKVIFIFYLLTQIGQNPYFCWFLVTLHRSFSSIFDPNDHVKPLIPCHKTDWKWQTIGNKKNSCNVLSKSLEIEIWHNAPKWIFQFLVPKYFRLHLVSSKNLSKTKIKKK